MAHNFECTARLVRLRAPLFAALMLAFAGCDTPDPVGPETTNPTDVAVEAVQVDEPSLASSSFAGGIPIGTFGQPVSAFGAHFNGAKITLAPNGALKYLAAVKARGGKVVLMLAGPKSYYSDRGGFNFSKWKARVDRFKNVKFTPYIKDGTIIGHLVVDEPNAPNSWHGHMISQAKVDEMARYSKSRWPGMATIVRTEPGYFKGHRMRYLDAAWAQYVTRKGKAPDFIRRNVADAKSTGLELVVGLNITKGGPNRRRMTVSEVKSFGSTLLASSYPCAFISWEYGTYQLKGSMRDAMRMLRSKAQSRGRKSCQG